MDARSQGGKGADSRIMPNRAGQVDNRERAHLGPGVDNAHRADERTRRKPCEFRDKGAWRDDRHRHETGLASTSHHANTGFWVADRSDEAEPAVRGREFQAGRNYRLTINERVQFQRIIVHEPMYPVCFAKIIYDAKHLSGKAAGAKNDHAFHRSPNTWSRRAQITHRRRRPPGTPA